MISWKVLHRLCQFNISFVSSCFVLNELGQSKIFTMLGLIVEKGVVTTLSTPAANKLAKRSTSKYLSGRKVGLDFVVIIISREELGVGKDATGIWGSKGEILLLNIEM